MIKAIIFDCFGVLTTDGFLPFREKYFSKNPELYARATTLDALTDSGRIRYNDFLTGVAALAHISKNEARKEIENNITDNTLLEFIKQELKPHFKLGMLSNAAANWLDELFSPEQIALFDATCLSFKTGHIKPQPAAYLTMANALHTPPKECLFIDDQPHNIEGARSVGMTALLYAGFEQLKTDTAKINSSNLSLKPPSIP